jgi:hypothetical protein
MRRDPLEGELRRKVRLDRSRQAGEHPALAIDAPDELPVPPQEGTGVIGLDGNGTRLDQAADQPPLLDRPDGGWYPRPGGWCSTQGGRPCRPHVARRPLRRTVQFAGGSIPLVTPA